MVNGQGHAAIGFSGSNASQFVASYFTGRLASDVPGTMGTVELIKAGEAAYTLTDGIGRNRWGDYSYTSLDPDDDMTFRTIQEYADTPTFFSSSWGTVVAQLLSPAPTLSDPAASGNPGAAGVVINLAGTGLFDSPDAMVPNGVDVTFSGAGISVNSTTFNSPTSVDVNIDIAAGAAIGTRDITLTNPDGQAATVVGGFTVEAPNAAPTITSDGGGATAAVSVAENQTAVTDVESTDDTDSEEAGLTYSKTGGADQALFTLDGTTGLLTFTAPPDFEAPGDAGGNNVYDVQVTVTDAGALTDVQDIAVTVTDLGGAGAAFTDPDPVLTPGVSVPRAIYITELRARVNALRLTLALPAFVFTDPTVTPGVTLVRDDHVIELRTALVDAYLANGLSAPVYTDPGLGAGTGIRALHITELRQFVIALE